MGWVARSAWPSGGKGPSSSQRVVRQKLQRKWRERFARLAGITHPFGLDVANPENVDRVVQAVLADHGRVDVLVNNAGHFGPIEWIADFPVEAWDQIFAVNARGAFLACRALLPSMVARGKGKIVNVGAGVLDRVDLACAAYSASKAALIVFTRMLAAEYRDAGIIAHIIDPGGLDTGMTAEIVAAEDAKSLRYHGPGQRAGNPNEKPACAWGTSDASTGSPSVRQ